MTHQHNAEDTHWLTGLSVVVIVMTTAAFYIA
jgi:hypothetical protein